MTARSLVIVVPINWAEQANTFLENAGFGPENLGTPARTVGSTWATHIGCHWWATPNDIFIIRQELIAAGFSAAQVDAAMSEFLFESGTIGKIHWLQKLSADGLEYPNVLTWFDPPVMAGDVQRHQGKDWQSQIDYNVYEPGVYKWIEV